MAATRPVVLVYQEFATLSSSPATPELNCLIAGPAYWVQDFPDHRADIKLASAYGTLNAAALANGASVAPAGGTDVITVAEPPNNKLGAVLDAASLRVFFSKARIEIAAGDDLTTAANSPTASSAADVNFTNAGVQAGDVVILTDSTPTTIVRKVRSVSGSSVTFTDELPGAGYTKFRVEREVADFQIPAAHVVNTSGTNEVVIKGGVTHSNKPVSYAEAYMAYRSLRQDLREVKTISSVTQVVGQLGAIDARNPLAVGVFLALQNTAGSIQYFGVQSDDLVGYNAMKSAISGRKDIYAVVPLTSDVSVIASLKAEFENLADPSYAVTNGVPQKFRVVIGSAGRLPLVKAVVDVNSDGDAQATAGTAPTAVQTLSFTTANAVDLVTLGILPGYKVVVDWDAGLAGAPVEYTVTHVNSATSLEIAETGLVAGSATGAFVSFKDAAGAAVGSQATTDVTRAAHDDLVLDLVDANGTFVDVGLMPGDLVEMPKSGTSFDAVDQWVVATVVSNQRLRVVNNGPNTATVANELPHGVTRTSPTALVPDTTLTYRVVRTLDKEGQADQLVSVANSIKSRRAIICWPDSVDVAGLKDGSLPRDAAKPLVAAAAPSQPGFYLACAVGGMTASLPSHQGFTNLGIAGIKKLHNANTYFEDRQVTKISNGGWFVFQQDTPDSLPYVIHQLTTDTSTLEFGEFSMVKNFDFVSLFMADILDDFIGIWNINPETIGFIEAAVKSGIESLKLRRKVRIGAPIIDAKLTSIGESPISADRLELYVEVDFPKPLNTVGLHIVSV